MLQTKKVSNVIRYLGLVIFVLLIISVVATNSVSAAGNYHDTLYEYIEGGATFTQVTTPLREKWDYTSSYAYNMKSNTDIDKVKVGGSEGPTLQDVVYDCTYGSPRSLLMGRSGYFPNLVKEREYDYACLTFEFYKVGAYLYIWWSPDSI